MLWFLIIFYYLDCTKCKFPDFSQYSFFSLTFNKIPWLFPDFCQVWNFPDFSLTTGHPVGGFVKILFTTDSHLRHNTSPQYDRQLHITDSLVLKCLCFYALWWTPLQIKCFFNLQSLFSTNQFDQHCSWSLIIGKWPYQRCSGPDIYTVKSLKTYDAPNY